MNHRPPFQDIEFPEPERYELQEGPHYRFKLNRREFVQVLGAGILISVAGRSIVAQRFRNDRAIELSDRLHIGEDGTMTVLTGKVEVGQGSRTQLAQAAAEELHVSLNSIRLIMADSSVVPNDGGTAGSRTTPSTVPSVRKACAAARELLLQSAASKFHVDANHLEVREGQVAGLDEGKRFAYTDLARNGSTANFNREVPSDIHLTPVHEWRLLGTTVPRSNAREIVTGSHPYPSDIRRPGMLFGVVLRPPSYNAELTGIDMAPVRKLPGVVAVHDGNFVGFAAPNRFEAEQALEAAAKSAQWKTESHTSSDELYEHLRNTASDRSRGDSKGSPEQALKESAKTLRESYNIAYVQHAPMETRAAVAEWNADDLTVWTGTQQPDRVRGELARTFRMPEEKVRVIVPDTGGGFGGKHTGETAVEAARLAKEAGKPVSLQWSREEEFTWAYFRPAGVIDLAAGLNSENRLTAWKHINFNSGSSAIETPYDISHTSTEYKRCDGPLRSGSYRALASTANNFARESFMDELAAEAGINPLEFRLRQLKNDRLRAVLIAAAERFGWENQWMPHTQPQTIGVGLACGIEKGSYVATCAKVEVDAQTQRFKVIRVTEAFECGAIHNPKNLQAQVEGCIIQGLGAVLKEEMQFQNGRILNPKFSQYGVPRFQDVPQIETVLVNRPDLPSVGAGETPIIGIAPAVGNALFHAVRTRIRSLPLRNREYRAA